MRHGYFKPNGSYPTLDNNFDSDAWNRISILSLQSLEPCPKQNSDCLKQLSAIARKTIMRKAAIANTILALVLLSQAAHAIEATEKSCADALEALGLSSDGYLLDEGFFSDTHTFGDNIECTDSDGHLNIRSGSLVVAEDGFYGEAALAARNAAQAAQQEQIKVLKAERDEKESIAEREYKEARIKVEEQAKNQLEQIRNNDIPASIAAVVSLERETMIAESRRKALRDIEKEKLKEMEEAEDNQKGFHCLGGWNGDQRYVTNAIKKSLNDPSSFDHEETRVARMKDCRHSFVMTYRAKNGFGAIVLGMAKGSYSNSDCSDIHFTSTN